MRRAFEILGSVFAVETEDARLVELLDVLYASFPGAGDARADMTLRVERLPDRSDYYDMWALRTGGERLVVEDQHFDRVVMNVAVYFNSEALLLADAHTVHAGVVARNGTAVAFPAASGGGKSTLAAACASAGLEYVSDEALCLDWQTGEVIPYPKPLWLSTWSRRALQLDGESVAFQSPRYEEALVVPMQLGWKVSPGGTKLGHIVQIATGADGTSLCKGPSRRTADLLIEHAFYKDRPTRSFPLVADLARTTQFWGLDVSDPQQAAEALSDLV